MTEAIRLDPVNAMAHYHRGLAHGELDELELALTDLDESIRLDPDHAGSYRAERRLSSLPRGIRPSYCRLRCRAATRPGRSDELSRKGSGPSKEGRVGPSYCRLQCRGTAGSQDIYAYRFRGDAYIAKENLPQAIRDFDVALSINPDDEVSYRRRGDAYLPSGNFDLAIAYYNGALECDPSSGPAYPTGDWSVSLWEILVARAKIAAAQESWDTTTPADRVRRRMPGTGDVERMLPSLPQAQISARD